MMSKFIETIKFLTQKYGYFIVPKEEFYYNDCDKTGFINTIKFGEYHLFPSEADALRRMEENDGMIDLPKFYTYGHEPAEALLVKVEMPNCWGYDTEPAGMGYKPKLNRFRVLEIITP